MNKKQKIKKLKEIYATKNILVNNLLKLIEINLIAMITFYIVANALEKFLAVCAWIFSAFYIIKLALRIMQKNKMIEEVKKRRVRK